MWGIAIIALSIVTAACETALLVGLYRRGKSSLARVVLSTIGFSGVTIFSGVMFSSAISGDVSDGWRLQVLAQSSVAFVALSGACLYVTYRLRHPKPEDDRPPRGGPRPAAGEVPVRWYHVVGAVVVLAALTGFFLWRTLG